MGLLDKANEGLSFTQRYHLETLKQHKARLNKDGSITTVFAVGVPYKGRIYNVPGYDRDSGLMVNPEDPKEMESLIQKWKPQIESGEIESFPSKFDGDIKDHPANVIARKEHEWIEQNRGSEANVGHFESQKR